MPGSRIRNHLRGNVVAYLALFFALSGGAYAITAPKNTVTSKSIKDGQIRAIDLRPGAVTAGAIAPDSVNGGNVIDQSLTGADLLDDSLTGSDIDESTLALPTPSGNPTGAAGGSLSGTYPNPTIASNAVTGAEVAGGSLAGSDLGLNTITGTQVDESTLGNVASATDASQLGGFAASSYVKSGTSIPAGDLSGTYGQPTLKTGTVGTGAFAALPAASIRIPQDGAACGGADLPLPDFTEDILLFSAQDYDRTGDMIGSCGSSRYLSAPILGTYAITANVSWEPGATGVRRLSIWRAGTTELASVQGPAAQPDTHGSHQTRQSVTTIARVSAGDRVDVHVLQSSGGDLDITGGSLAMAWISP